MTPNTNLKNDYTIETPVSASDLNRRANLVDTQIPGAFSALGVGVVGLSSLEVTGESGSYVVAPGQAIIVSSDANGRDAHPITGYLRSEKSVSPTDAFPYVFAKLVIATVAGAPDVEEGTAELAVIVSADEEYPGALLLAERKPDGTLVDRREFFPISDLIKRCQQLEADSGYDVAARAVGTIAARLANLETPSGGGGGGGSSLTYISQLGFNAEDNRPADVVIKELIHSAVEAAISQVVPGRRVERQPLDLIVHEQQITRRQVAILEETMRVMGNLLLTEEQREAFAELGLTTRVRIIEQSQSVNIGPGFGSGENSGPNFEGAGPAKNTNGTFGVTI